MFLQKNLAIPKIDSIAMFLRRQISLGLCLHLLLERIIPATPWRTHVLWISPPLGEPEAKRKLLLAREERRQDLPEHNAGKPRSAFKPSLTLWRIVHRSSQAAQCGGHRCTAGNLVLLFIQTKRCFQSSERFQEADSSERNWTSKNTALVNKLFQKYALDGPKNVPVKVHTAITSFFLRTILTACCRFVRTFSCFQNCLQDLNNQFLLT